MKNTISMPDEFVQGESTNYKNWQSRLPDIKTCQDCYEKHGLIFVSFDHAQTFYELIK